MKKNLKLIIATSAVILIIIIALMLKIFSQQESKASNSASLINMPTNVKAHIVQLEKLSNNVLATGTIRSNEEVELRSETSGKITNIFFREGAYVNKGDLLVKINDADLQAQLRKVESKIKLSKEREFRQKQLLNSNMISQEEYDNTVNDLNVNQADYDLIKAQIDKTEIRAPFGGVVGLRSVSEGSYVTTATVIARLQNFSTLKIDFSIPERYSFVVNTGDELSFKVSGSDKIFKAKVYAVEPKIDQATRTLQIRAICSTYYKELVPGAFANIELKLKEIGSAILIPTVAIVPELKGQFVYLYKSGIVVPQNVEVGIREELRVQVVTGLGEGDTVITSGILQIRPGANVNITEFN
jgi:membrane fusion protein (multidrug efflux system)